MSARQIFVKRTTMISFAAGFLCAMLLSCLIFGVRFGHPRGEDLLPERRIVVWRGTPTNLVSLVEIRWKAAFGERAEVRRISGEGSRYRQQRSAIGFQDMNNLFRDLKVIGFMNRRERCENVANEEARATIGVIDGIDGVVRWHVVRPREARDGTWYGGVIARIQDVVRDCEYGPSSDCDWDTIRLLMNVKR